MPGWKRCLSHKVWTMRSVSHGHPIMQRRRSQPFEVSITSLLPLLRDQAHSVATLKHAMKKIQDTEEADTRIFVHARDATQDGCKSLIKANDTDVVIIAVSVLPSLQQLGVQSMWIDFGQGANAQWIPVHELLSAIGPEKANEILYFHAFTGCDVMSAFHRKGKKYAWLTWDVCEEVSETFTRQPLSHRGF